MLCLPLTRHFSHYNTDRGLDAERISLIMAGSRRDSRKEWFAGGIVYLTSLSCSNKLCTLSCLCVPNRAINLCICVCLCILLPGCHDAPMANPYHDHPSPVDCSHRTYGLLKYPSNYWLPFRGSCHYPHPCAQTTPQDLVWGIFFFSILIHLAHFFN